MTDDIYAYARGFLFLLIFSNIAVWLYVAFTKLTQIENHLANCKLVNNNRRIWGGEPIGRVHRLAQINGMLSFPKIIVKNGEADLEEIMGLPVSLRRWVKIPFGTGVALLFAMIILYVYGKYFLG
ncbi:MAG TPA: hypothetical protein VFM75_02490 [Modicisalibacter sp.]|nr:hypothetical protein [Modicisalibacter sp.]